MCQLVSEVLDKAALYVLRAKGNSLKPHISINNQYKENVADCFISWRFFF